MDDSTITGGQHDSGTFGDAVPVVPPAAKAPPRKASAAAPPAAAPPVAARMPAARPAKPAAEEVEDLDEFEEIGEYEEIVDEAPPSKPAPASPEAKSPEAKSPAANSPAIKAAEPKAPEPKAPEVKAISAKSPVAKSPVARPSAAKAKAKNRPAAEEAAADEDAVAIAPTRRFRLGAWLRGSSAMLISTVVHMALIIILSLCIIEPTAIPRATEVIAHMLDVPKEELTSVELENQITEVTEVTQQIFSSSPVVGVVGASGPRGAVSAPTMDRALLEQAVTNSDVSIEGVFLDTPPSKKLIVEAPDGQIGEARAVVDSYQEALDQLTQEILWMLEKGDVLVVWAFDQSESMKNDQKEIRERMEHVYKQLGLVSKHNSNALETAIVSYGKGFAVHTRKPTSDMDEIRAAISEVPNDPSGKEMMCSTVAQAISMHRPYAQRTKRQMALVMLTDESGDQEDNNTQLERAIAEAKAARCRVYMMGREAVFSYPYAHIRWVHPQTKHVHWLQIDRGPETAFVEQLQTDGFHRRYDAHPSGYGPYECTRLGRETGGIFFMLPSLESDLVRGEKRKYELEAMRPYMPDLRSRLEVSAERDASPLRTMLTKVIYDLNPYNPETAKIIEMRVHFSPKHVNFIQQALREQQKAIIYLQYLARAEKEVAKMEKERRYEASPRWQANYDLLHAQLVAYQARMYEYGAYLEEFMKKPKIVPVTKPPNLTLDYWDIVTRKRTITGDVVKPYIDRATVMFQQVIENHPGTPWAARAEYELKRGFGVELMERYEGPYPVIPPGTPIMPVPKF